MAPTGASASSPDESHSPLVRFGRRDFSPETGRWTAKDPIRFDGGSTALYEYARGNPVDRIDPWGTTYIDIGVSFGLVAIGLQYDVDTGDFVPYAGVQFGSPGGSLMIGPGTPSNGMFAQGAVAFGFGYAAGYDEGEFFGETGGGFGVSFGVYYAWDNDFAPPDEPPVLYCE